MELTDTSHKKRWLLRLRGCLIALLILWLWAMWQLSSIPCGYLNSWLYQFEDVITEDRKYLFRNVEFNEPYSASRFSETGKQVIVPDKQKSMAGWVRRTSIYDSETGQLKSQFYKSWLHEYAEYLVPACWLAIMVWFFGWIRSSISLGLAPVWDAVFVHLFALMVVS